MKKVYTLVSTILLSVLLLSMTGYTHPENEPKQKRINWMTLDEVQEKMKTKPKKIFIDLYTDWCGWCKVLDRDTYTQPEVINYLNKNYYSVKFDAEQREDVSFAGNVFKFVPSGRSGYHELAAALTENNLSYPTLVFISKKEKPITYVSGFQSANDLMDMLVFINKDLHLNKSVSFKKFKARRVAERRSSRGGP